MNRLLPCCWSAPNLHTKYGTADDNDTLCTLDQPPEAASTKRLRILAFGDSLTEGYTHCGTFFHPYADRLQTLLQQVNPDVEVVMSGISGECVLDSMQDRLEQALQGARQEGQRFSWVLILGGINDIGCGASAYAVHKGLVALYETCRKHRAKVLAMTCLQNSGTPMGATDKDRRRLNEMIRDHCHDNDVLLLDLEKRMPYVRSDGKDAHFDMDGLHLLPQGYDHMADLIFKALKGRVQVKSGQKQ